MRVFRLARRATYNSNSLPTSVMYRAKTTINNANIFTSGSEAITLLSMQEFAGSSSPHNSAHFYKEHLECGDKFMIFWLHQ